MKQSKVLSKWSKHFRHMLFNWITGKSDSNYVSGWGHKHLLESVEWFTIIKFFYFIVRVYTVISVISLLWLTVYGRSHRQSTEFATRGWSPWGWTGERCRHESVPGWSERVWRRSSVLVGGHLGCGRSFEWDNTWT